VISREWDGIQHELLSMAEEDFRLRGELAADGSLFEGYHPSMRALHDAHAERLGTILDSFGWPGRSQVGPEAAEAAWVIVQHAIAQPSLQRRALELLKAAVQHGDAAALRAAMLEDRIRTLEGKLQRFGTQFDWDAAGQLSPLPMEDPAAVDARRKEVGLGPLDEAARDLRAAAEREGERPPRDWPTRQREMDAWCREVGWRARDPEPPLSPSSEFKPARHASTETAPAPCRNRNAAPNHMTRAS
jgi:hypothetical protein